VEDAPGDGAAAQGSRSAVADERALPAWSLPPGAADQIRLDFAWPERVTREWAWGGSTGAGARVCILDSGVQSDHPLVGELEGAVAVSRREDGTLVVEEDAEGDLSGHGTACAGIVRALAPESSIFSVRVLGAGFKGSGAILLEGLRWAIGERFDVINMSLSTTKSQFAGILHDLADSAYFRRTVLVASAHNMPVESYPWRFSSVISVGSHEEQEPETFYYNPAPPVEFFGRGVDVEIAWVGGGTIRATGNSFATPHMSGICALILSKHPELTPFQLKSVLYLTASNVGGSE
jgi:subtilisin family serine protease